MRGKVPFRPGPPLSEIEAAQPRRALPSKYGALVAAACSLRHGATLTVPMSFGRDRIKQALARYVPEDHKALKRFEVRVADRPGGRAIVVACFVRSREAR